MDPFLQIGTAVNGVYETVLSRVDKSPFTVGRSIDSDLLVKISRTVSRNHFILNRTNNGWVLKNKSRHGTVINTGLVRSVLTMNKSQLLKDQDIIFINPKTIFKFIYPSEDFDYSTVQENRDQSVIFCGTTRSPVDDLDNSSNSTVDYNVREYLPPSEKRPTAETTSNEPAKKSKIEIIDLTESVEPQPSTSSGSCDNNQLRQEVTDEMICSICSMLFITPTTLNCSHTFCDYCIRMWRKRNPMCPICRTCITTSCRTLVIENMISKILSTATEADFKQRQDELKERKKLDPITTGPKVWNNFIPSSDDEDFLP